MNDILAIIYPDRVVLKTHLGITGAIAMIGGVVDYLSVNVDRQRWVVGVVHSKHAESILWVDRIQRGGE